MVNFGKLQKEIKKYDSERERLIIKSREVLKLSKQLIYAIHRDEMKAAEKLLEDIEREKQNLDRIAAYNYRMLVEGSYRVAVQEYVEAALYYAFVRSGSLPDLKVPPELYVLGLCDLPGELVRKAVFLAGKGQSAEVIKIRDQVDEIYGELLKFDLRDNETRRKADAVKYDLRKLEDLVLELRLKGR